MKTSVTPLGENVLVKPEEPSIKTDSGIFLPENASADRPQEGKVIAVGDSDTIKVKKNQKVVFKKYSETEITIDGENYYIIKNEDILAIVE